MCGEMRKLLPDPELHLELVQHIQWKVIQGEYKDVIRTDVG